MLAVAVPKRNKLQNIIVLTPKDGDVSLAFYCQHSYSLLHILTEKSIISVISVEYHTTISFLFQF